MQVAPLALQEVSLAKDYMHLPTTAAFGTAAQPFQTHLLLILKLRNSKVELTSSGTLGLAPFLNKYWMQRSKPL